MATHSSTLAWKIPRTEEPGRLQSMWSLRVGHVWATSFTFHFPALDKEMATHSSTLAWKIPWKEEPGRLQSMWSRRVGHDWATSLSCIGEGNGNPLQCSCLENPRDEGAWWATVHRVTQSRTRLKRLSSSSSSRAFTVIPFMDMCMLNVAKKVIYLPHEHVLSWGQIRFLSDILFHLSYCKMCSFHALFSATFSTFLFFLFLGNFSI